MTHDPAAQQEGNQAGDKQAVDMCKPCFQVEARRELVGTAVTTYCQLPTWLSILQA